MESSVYAELDRYYLIWSVNILRIFTTEAMKFRALVLQMGDASLKIHFVTSILDVCEKLEHISDVILCLIRNKKSFTKKITALVDIQKKLEEVKQAKISEGILTAKIQKGKKCTKETETKANISEEKSKEKREEKKDGDSTEAKSLKKDSKANISEEKSPKEKREEKKDGDSTEAKSLKKDSKANISEEKSSKEKHEEKKDGDSTEAKSLKKDSKEKKTHPEETKILKKRVEKDCKDAKRPEKEARKSK